MWNLANELFLLWLQTGNMTERALGYTTIGGDLMGGFSLIGNLPKTLIAELLRYLSETRFQHLKSLKRLLDMPASAELADNQSDEADLMPYIVADVILFLLVGRKLSAISIYAVIFQRFAGMYSGDQLRSWLEKFMLLFHRSVFKWKQGPPTLHLGNIDLALEGALRLPIVHSRF
jgi:NAD+ synthase (glutamine-hydrolysing)